MDAGAHPVTKTTTTCRCSQVVDEKGEMRGTDVVEEEEQTTDWVYLSPTVTGCRRSACWRISPVKIASRNRKLKLKLP